MENFYRFDQTLLTLAKKLFKGMASAIKDQVRLNF
jgi:hypothetical protein